MNGVGSENLSTLLLAGYLPSTAEYTTQFRVFPGNEAHAPWGLTGKFHISLEVFDQGKSAGKTNSDWCDENGNLQLDAESIVNGRDVTGMFMMEYRHAASIPVSVYSFHVHKATGTYVACNTLSFVGDKLYQASHDNSLENALFWSGFPSSGECAPHVVLINPFDTVMGFQVHLTDFSGRRLQSKVLRLKHKEAKEAAIADLFPSAFSGDGTANGGYSLCVSSQYKLVTYFMLKSRAGVISLLDHMNAFYLV